MPPSVCRADQVGFLLYATMWKAIVGLHFVQDMTTGLCFTESTINQSIY